MTAARIKALVWREWRIIRKGYLSSMIMLFMVAGFFWLIRLSMSVGNLAPIFGDSEILKEFGGLLYYVGTSRARLRLDILTTLDNDACLRVLQSLGKTDRVKRPQRDLARALNALPVMETGE